MKKHFAVYILMVSLLLSGCSKLFAPLPPLPEMIVLPSATVTPIPPTLTATPTTILTLTPTETLAPSSTPFPTETPIFTLTPFPSPTTTITSTKRPPYYLSRGDLHMHTTCSDGKNTYDEMVKMALVWNYGFIAITDHHMCNDVKDLCRSDDRLTCIYGQEVAGDTKTQIEILAIGITTPIAPGKSAPEIVQLIHAQGGIAIAAHPWGENGKQRFSQEQLLYSGLDAMECMTDGSKPFDFDTSSLPCVYDSDAHSTFTLDPEHSNTCDMRIRSVGDLLIAIQSGRCHQGEKQ
jgi:hypothetical protein